MLSQKLLSYLVLVCAQVVLYQVSMKQALRNYWFLGLFYFLVFSCVQGLVIFCAYLSISFFVLPVLCLLAAFLLKNRLKGAPQFQKRILTLPNFYLFSGLWISLVWTGELMNQTVLTAPYNFMEAFIWCLFSALLFPVLAGIKERLDLMDTPAGFSITGIFFVAAGFLLLGFSFF